jgi:glutamate racemase
VRSRQVNTVRAGEDIGEHRPYPASIQSALGPSGEQEPTETEPFCGLAAMCPIGVFDSGVGGLSVVAEIRRVLPHEDIVYFGDNANCPYGGRSDDWLRARSLEIAAFLLEHGAKAIVVACNTASAAGLDHLRARYGVPVVGLVPAVKPAVAATRTGKVGVLATPATIRGRLLADVIERFAAPAGVQVISVAPDGVVEAIERGELDTPQTAELVARALAPILQEGADAIVLGSTHFPFLKPVIRRVVGEGVLIFDSGEGVARQTRRVLEAHRVLRGGGAPGRLTVYTSGDPTVVGPLVHRLTGEQTPVIRAYVGRNQTTETQNNRTN